MEELDLKNFDKIYDEKIAPKLEEFEQQRKKTLIKCIFVIIATTIFIAYISNWFNYSSSKNTIIMFLFMSLMIIFIGFVAFAYFIFEFKRPLKINFYKKIFDSIGFKYNNTYDGRTEYKKNVHAICKKSDYYSQCAQIVTNDLIIGTYNNLPFVAIDTWLRHTLDNFMKNKKKKKKNAEHKTFRGIVLQTKINKPLNCDILIKKDELINKEKLGKKEKVNLESIEFEEMFDVYSDDQIEARYILTPSFMERLMNYTKTRNDKAVEIYLSNKISEEYNVFFFLHTNKDNFEVPLLKPITDKKVFYNILKELTDALDIISELKLEQNIGL